MFGNVPTLCGGNDNYHHSFDSCISFQNSKWSQNHYMTVRRANTAGVQINLIPPPYWKVGYLDSTEFIIQGQTKGVPGPKLPYRKDIV